MASMRRYRKKADQFVIAVQVNLELEGFIYRKWGGRQHCKQGDWLVDNHGDVYSVDRDVFAATYRPVNPGIYVKVTPVWAEVAAESGAIPTKEGWSRYQPGDYLVFNDKEGTDAYCVAAETFESMYELDE
ncbi:MAG: hypothetical protein PVF20_04200 [Desulfobacterales bacterium]